MTHATFADGDAYEAYAGRWSRPVARAFIRRLNVPAGRDWLDLGCGTGALTETVPAMADPAKVTGVDRSAAFVGLAQSRVGDARAAFQVGDAELDPASAAWDEGRRPSVCSPDALRARSAAEPLERSPRSDPFLWTLDVAIAAEIDPGDFSRARCGLGGCRSAVPCDDQVPGSAWTCGQVTFGWRRVRRCDRVLAMTYGIELSPVR